MRRPIPLSAEAIANDLADRIERGDRDHEPGSRLPSYLELANLYEVSVSTIANVIVRLKERGLVVGAQGRGVFVADKDD
jgi:DNA-binding GntR family transcriptional regulator